MDWAEPVMAEFLRATEEEMLRLGWVGPVHYQMIKEALTRADYGAVRESLRGMEDRIEKAGDVLIQMQAKNMALETEAEYVRGQFASLTAERDALVKYIENAGLGRKGSRFYEQPDN